MLCLHYKLYSAASVFQVYKGLGRPGQEAQLTPVKFGYEVRKFI